VDGSPRSGSPKPLRVDLACRGPVQPFWSNRADLAIGMTLNPLRCNVSSPVAGHAKRAGYAMQISPRRIGERREHANVRRSLWRQFQLVAGLICWASHALQGLPPPPRTDPLHQRRAARLALHQQPLSSRAFVSGPDVEGASLPALSVCWWRWRAPGLGLERGRIACSGFTEPLAFPSR